MKTRKLLYLFSAPLLIVGLLSWYSGGSPGGKTGSPGDAGANCTQCHSGSPQTASGWITTNIPPEGYTPGQTYLVAATGTHTGVVKFGFETTIEDNSGTKKGTIIVTDGAQTKLTNNNSAITHTQTGNTPNGNSKTWTFNWVAPAEGSGDLTFYGAFNAANGNGNNQGDVIYLTNTVVSEYVPSQTDLTVSFSGMTPHIGQKLEIRLLNMDDLTEAARQIVDPVPGAIFDVVFADVENGSNFLIDFFADHNDNGMYDAPPTDHAWRLKAENVQGGDEITFTHNTDFTDIDWKHLLTLNFFGMNPHQGQQLEISLRDITLSYEETFVMQIDAINSPDFMVTMPALTPGHTYNVDFYADHNGNGIYDSPPADHAWQLKTEAISGDLSIDFTHNTDFTDIGWSYSAELNLNGMNPHVDQLIMFRVTDKETGLEVSRYSRIIDVPDFSVRLPGLMIGREYNVDFFADHNGNGIYDAPPTDHAWSLSTDEVTGNTSLDFSHNTDFTDIDWRYLTTFHATSMTPHIGQKFELRVYNQNTFEEIGLMTLEEMELAEFYIKIGGAEMGEKYNVDFYADHNGNGVYDSPPEDHAWRIAIEEQAGDTILFFEHNTDFTDIMWPVAIEEAKTNIQEVSVYPNPFSNSAKLSFEKLDENPVWVGIYGSDGRNIAVYELNTQDQSLIIDTKHFKSGVYHLLIKFENNQTMHKTIIKY